MPPNRILWATMAQPELSPADSFQLQEDYELEDVEFAVLGR